MKVEVCLTPELLHLFPLKGKVVVVVDILRATSCMVTAMAHEVKTIIPVAKVEQCKALQATGLICAAERDGKKVEGFDLDNSPFSYMQEHLKHKTIAVTTTNGTQAITLSAEADSIVIGAFLNISTVADYLLKLKKEVLIVCSGWKGQFNLEDTLFAGALAEKLKSEFSCEQDATVAAHKLYTVAKNNLSEFVSTAQHVKRLAALNITNDIAFCLQFDTYRVLPICTNGKITNVLS